MASADASKKNAVIIAVCVLAVIAAAIVIFRTVWQPLPPPANADNPMDLSKSKMMKNQPPGGYQ
jgi:hypothetical protein